MVKEHIFFELSDGVLELQVHENVYSQNKARYHAHLHMERLITALSPLKVSPHSIEDSG